MMTKDILENNEVEILGKIHEALTFSHEVYGEGFYTFMLEAPRLSDVSDYIPITVSERLLKDITLQEEDEIAIVGQFRSYNNYNCEGNKLILKVFAQDIQFIQKDQKIKNPNTIFLDGFICKLPIYRTTPFGREICDILLAVNRAYNKSDYIPCIAWGRNARYCSTLSVGQNIKVWGRIQSRDYQKKINDQESIKRVAYEVSISKMELVEEE